MFTNQTRIVFCYRLVGLRSERVLSLKFPYIGLFDLIFE